MSKKVIAGILILGAAGAGIWYYLKNKKVTAAAAAIDPAATIATPETNAVNALDAALKSDPIWQNKSFPTDFYPTVATEYQAQVNGNPRTIDYEYGKPGAFMSIADAWQMAMGYSDDTHAKLWQIYSQWVSASQAAALNKVEANPIATTLSEPVSVSNPR